MTIISAEVANAEIQGSLKTRDRCNRALNRHLPPSNPLSAPLRQVLTMRNQTLMARAGEHRDAMPTDLGAEVLAGEVEGIKSGTGPLSPAAGRPSTEPRATHRHL